MVRNVAAIGVLCAAACFAGCSSEDDDGPVPNKPPEFGAPSASQMSAGRGASVLFTAPCSDPDGTLVQVLLDLSPVGGSPFSGMYDNGTLGDLTAGDSVWSLRTSIPAGAVPQAGVTLVITATDDDGAQSSASLAGFEVTSNYAPSISTEQVSPAQARSGMQVTFTAMVADSDGTLGLVSIDLSPMNGPASQQMYDDGAHGDYSAGDGAFGAQYNVPASAPLGTRSYVMTAVDDDGDSSRSQVNFQVVANVLPTLSAPTAFPNPAMQGQTAYFSVEAADSDGTVASCVVNLTTVGGSASATMYDDGVGGGDVSAGDGKYSCMQVISYSCTTGAKSCTVTATDDSSGQATVPITFTVTANVGPVITDIVQKNSAGTTMYYFVPQEELTIACKAEDAQDGVSAVTVNLTAIGGSSAEQMYDDGLHGDQAASDDTWGVKFFIPATAAAGMQNLVITASDGATPAAQTQANLTVRIIQVRMHKSATLNGLGGLGSSVCAVGNKGALYRWNGTDWMMENTKNPATEKKLFDCAMFSTTSMAVGAGYCSSEYKNGVWTYSLISGSTAREIRSVWGSSSTDVYAVGGAAADPQFWRWNGASWTQMTPLPGAPTDSYLAVDGFNSTQFIAVGHNGLITRGNGSSPAGWTDESISTTTDFYGVWHAGSNNYYAVGGNGTNPSIYRSQTAGTWAPTASIPSATSVDLRGVWGSSATSIWVVGTGGTIWRTTDGANFSNFASPTTKDLYAIWGSGGSDIWAAGADGIVLHYTGSSWSIAASSGGTDIEAIAAISSSQLWAFDSAGTNSAIHYYNGSSWATETNPLSPAVSFRKAFAVSSTEVWAVGDSAAVVCRQSGTWSQITPPGGLGATNLHSVWGPSSGNAFVGGQNGHFWGCSSSTWTQYTGINGTATVDDIWGDVMGNLYAVAGSVLYYNNGITTTFSTVTVPGAGNLNSVWGSGQNDVWVVGDGGRIAHNTGLGFNSVTIPGSPTANFNAVFGYGTTEVFVVGDDFRIYRYDGTNWKNASMSCQISLLCGLAGSAHVFFSGQDGTVYQLFR